MHNYCGTVRALLIPNVRKTWAPIGCAPHLRHSYRRDKVSVISALAVAPRRRRRRWYFDLHVRNITGAEVTARSAVGRIPWAHAARCAIPPAHRPVARRASLVPPRVRSSVAVARQVGSETTGRSRRVAGGAVIRCGVALHSMVSARDLARQPAENSKDVPRPRR